MVYMGIKFDDWVNDIEECNSYWSEICKKCYHKYKNVFGKNRVDDCGSGVACCGIEGCTSENAGIYVDFKSDEISFVED